MVTITDTANRTFYSNGENNGPTDWPHEVLSVQPATGGTVFAPAVRLIIDRTVGTNTQHATFFNNVNTDAFYDHMDLYTTGISSVTGAGVRWDNSTIVLMAALATNQQLPMQQLGEFTFNNCTIAREAHDGTVDLGRLILGPSGLSSTWTTTGSTIIGFTDNEISMVYQGAPAANTTNTNLTLIGNVGSEFSGASTSVGTTWNDGGSTANSDDGRYVYRITQFNGTAPAGNPTLLSNDNVLHVETGNDNTGSPTNDRYVALFAGDDLRNIASAGNDTTFSGDNLQTFVMINRGAAHWIVGGRWTGTLPVGHHTVNRPNPTQPAEIRSLTPWHPAFVTPFSGTLNVDFRVRFYDTDGEIRAAAIPTNWDMSSPSGRNAIPIFRSGRTHEIRPTIAQYWIEQHREVYNTGTQTTGDSSPATVAGIPEPDDVFARIRSYDYIFASVHIIDIDRVHENVTGLITNNNDTIDIESDEALFGVTQSQAQTLRADLGNDPANNNLSSIDQLYAVLKYGWFEDSTEWTVTLPVVYRNGTELDFGSRNVTLTPGSGYNVDWSAGGDISIGMAEFNATTNVSMLRSTGTITATNAGTSIQIQDQNSPGAGDVVFNVPDSWTSINARYAVYVDEGTTVADRFPASGPTSNIQRGQIIVRGVTTGIAVRLAIVHPEYTDVLLAVNSSAAGVATATVGAPVINSVAAAQLDAFAPGNLLTFADYFEPYDGTVDVNPDVTVSPTPANGISVSWSVTNERDQLADRLTGVRGNYIGHQMKNATDDYARIVARQNAVDQVSATSIFNVTFSANINFAFTRSIAIEETVTFNGTTGTATVSGNSLRSFSAPTVDYDIVETRVTSGTEQAMDNRSLTTDNIGNLGLLKPARDADGNILQGN